MTNSCQPYASFCVILTTSADLMGMELDGRLKNNSSKHAGGLPYPLYIARTNANTKLVTSSGAQKLPSEREQSDAVARAGMERAALRR